MSDPIDSSKQRDQVGGFLLDTVRGLKTATGTTPNRIANCEEFESAIIAVRNNDWEALGALAASKAPRPRKGARR